VIGVEPFQLALLPVSVWPLVEVPETVGRRAPLIVIPGVFPLAAQKLLEGQETL